MRPYAYINRVSTHREDNGLPGGDPEYSRGDTFVQRRGAFVPEKVGGDFGQSGEARFPLDVGGFLDPPTYVSAISALHKDGMMLIPIDCSRGRRKRSRCSSATEGTQTFATHVLMVSMGALENGPMAPETRPIIIVCQLGSSA